MTRSIWTQRLIALLDALVFGFVIDRASPSPLYGFVAGLLLFIVLLFILRRKPKNEGRLKLDSDAKRILGTVALSLLFFFLCAMAAYLILS